MGLTTQYLRFVPSSIFGIIASRHGNILFVDASVNNNCALVSACENVLMWNYRTCEIIKCFKGEKHAVTCFCLVTSTDLAVGYADGAIRVFNIALGKLTISFHGHKSAVSCLTYDSKSLRLASGGKDTELVLWDILAEKGLFRLKGHKGSVTKCQFVKDSNILISSSEDTLLKFWDLNSQHCFKTLTGNRSEVWDFIVLGERKLITGINDADLRVWDLEFKEFSNLLPLQEEEEILSVKEIGKIITADDKRTISLNVDDKERLLGCHGYSNSLQLFKLLTPEETKKKMKKRIKKEEKLAAENNDPSMINQSVTLSDQIRRLTPIKANSKIISFNIQSDSLLLAKIIILLNNNSFSVYELELKGDGLVELMYSILTPGHRSHINTVAYSSDCQILLTASGESLKLWNSESQNCTHTFNCGYALCSAFVTGNNYCIIGTKNGELQIFDLSTQQLVDTIEAHSDATSCLCPTSDQSGITSGGKDKDIKFWNYELIKDINYSETKKRLSLALFRTLKMPEEILCLKYCRNNKYLAVSLLDSTVKIFFCDTLKFAFTLYGHKLPIPCIDISYDSTILISGSKDRNIKIWSLEFGNCLKSIFAHEESITCLQFIPKTHMFFSSGKDKKIKQWDADNFKKILTLEGHQNKINVISVSPDGRTVASVSDDNSIRLWEKTDDIVVLEEEEENERELEADAQLAMEELAIVGETNKEVGLAAKTTLETIKDAEQLIESIDIYKEELIMLKEYNLKMKNSSEPIQPPLHHPLLRALSLTCPYRFMLKAMQKIQLSHLEQTLLHLPFNYVIDFLKILTNLLSRNWKIELCTRCIMFLLHIHLRQILMTDHLLPVIVKLRKVLVQNLKDEKDTIGFNMAGLKFLQKEIEDTQNVCLFTDATQALKRKTRKRHLINFV